MAIEKPTRIRKKKVVKPAKKKVKKAIPNGGGIIKDTIKEYARTLYLKLDTNGEKKYSNSELRNILLEKFKKPISDITLIRWSKEWKDDFIQIKTRALEKANEKSKEEPIDNIDYAALKNETDADIDKELIDNQAENLALIFYNAKQRYILGNEILIKRLLCQSTIEFKRDEYNIDITAPYAAIVKMIESGEATMLKLLESKKEEGLLQAFLGTLPDDVLQRLLKKIS